MTWNPSNRTLEAFHPGTCCSCGHLIESAQIIQKSYSGGWKHFNLRDCAGTNKSMLRTAREAANAN